MLIQYSKAILWDAGTEPSCLDPRVVLHSERAARSSLGYPKQASNGRFCPLWVQSFSASFKCTSWKLQQSLRGKIEALRIQHWGSSANVPSRYDAVHRRLESWAPQSVFSNCNGFGVAGHFEVTQSSTQSASSRASLPLPAHSSPGLWLMTGVRRSSLWSDSGSLW